MGGGVEMIQLARNIAFQIYVFTKLILKLRFDSGAIYI